MTIRKARANFELGALKAEAEQRRSKNRKKKRQSKGSFSVPLDLPPVATALAATSNKHSTATSTTQHNKTQRCDCVPLPLQLWHGLSTVLTLGVMFLYQQSRIHQLLVYLQPTDRQTRQSKSNACLLYLIPANIRKHFCQPAAFKYAIFSSLAHPSSWVRPS